MALFMDIHTMDGPVSAARGRRRTTADLKTQGRYGVDYRQYWVDEAQRPDLLPGRGAGRRGRGLRPPRGARPGRRRDLPGRRRRVTGSEWRGVAATGPRSPATP